MADPFGDLPSDYVGDKLPWTELSDADLQVQVMVRGDNWIGNVALLVAHLERVGGKEAPTIFDWRALRVCMGDNDCAEPLLVIQLGLHLSS